MGVVTIGAGRQWCIAKNRGGYTLNETPKASRIEPPKASRIEPPKAARGEGNGKEVPPPQPTRGSGERRKLPQWGPKTVFSAFRA